MSIKKKKNTQKQQSYEKKNNIQRCVCNYINKHCNYNETNNS